MNTEPLVCILDYGSGNVRSVMNILAAMNTKAVISNDPEIMHRASHLLLPGVGSFGSAMEKIKKNIPVGSLEEEVFKNKKPFLGICVGMQVLADIGREFGEHKGLGWIKGEVIQLESKDAPLPHIGWNVIKMKNNSPIISGLPAGTDMYFVHSFAFHPGDPDTIIAETNYGEDFPSIIGKENIFGVQFHPEKSQEAGKLIIRNFLNTK